MKRNRLKYAGHGQIVREADGRLVSPCDVVTWFNDVCDIADELHKTLTSVLDALAFAQQLKSPAEGVQSQELRNGEAEAVANAVGRESVAQGRTRSNTTTQSSARPAPKIAPRKRDTYAKVAETRTGRQFPRTNRMTASPAR